MEAEYTRSVKQSILDYVLLDPAEQRRLGLDMPQPVSIMHGSIWSVAMLPPGIPPGICIFFLSRWSLPHPRAPYWPHIRFFGVHLFESDSEFCTIAKRDVFRNFINISRVNWEKDKTCMWLTHEQYIWKRKGMKKLLIISLIEHFIRKLDWIYVHLY